MEPRLKNAGNPRINLQPDGTVSTLPTFFTGIYRTKVDVRFDTF